VFTTGPKLANSGLRRADHHPDGARSRAAGCGSEPESAAPASPRTKEGHVPARKFRWKWTLLAIPTLLALQISGGLGIALTGHWSPAVVVPMTFVSFFVGGLLVAYWSPGVTIREPAIGIAISVVLTNLVLAKSSGAGLVAGWIVPTLLGFTGAVLGERMQTSRRR
jgi:peptidoglycan/LPS O-acetylase OafA/YrhL